MTIDKIILKLLRENPDRWWFSYELVKVNTPHGWIGTSGDRRARKLAEIGLLMKRDHGRYVQFKAKPPAKVIEYKSNGESLFKEEIYET